MKKYDVVYAKNAPEVRGEAKHLTGRNSSETIDTHIDEGILVDAGIDQ